MRVGDLVRTERGQKVENGLRIVAEVREHSISTRTPSGKINSWSSRHQYKPTFLTAEDVEKLGPEVQYVLRTRGFTAHKEYCHKAGTKPVDIHLWTEMMENINNRAVRLSPGTKYHTQQGRVNTNVGLYALPACVFTITGGRTTHQPLDLVRANGCAGYSLRVVKCEAAGGMVKVHRRRHDGRLYVDSGSALIYRPTVMTTEDVKWFYKRTIRVRLRTLDEGEAKRLCQQSGMVLKNWDQIVKQNKGKAWVASSATQGYVTGTGLYNVPACCLTMDVGQMIAPKPKPKAKVSCDECSEGCWKCDPYTVKPVKKKVFKAYGEMVAEIECPAGWDKVKDGYCLGDFLIFNNGRFWKINHPTLRLDNGFKKPIDAANFIKENLRA